MVWQSASSGLAITEPVNLRSTISRARLGPLSTPMRVWSHSRLSSWLISRKPSSWMPLVQLTTRVPSLTMGRAWRSTSTKALEGTATKIRSAPSSTWSRCSVA